MNQFDPKMLKWLLGGSKDSHRSFEFLPWENDNEAGLDGVRCKLRVYRGSAGVPGAMPYEERYAEGTGMTMEEAFTAAYENLVGWLV